PPVVRPGDGRAARAHLPEHAARGPRTGFAGVRRARRGAGRALRDSVGRYRPGCIPNSGRPCCCSLRRDDGWPCAAVGRNGAVPTRRYNCCIALRIGCTVFPYVLKETGRRTPVVKPMIGKRVEVNFVPPLSNKREDDPAVRKEKAEALTAQLLAAITALTR